MFRTILHAVRGQGAVAIRNPMALGDDPDRLEAETWQAKRLQELGVARKERA
jgi:hypothetical protein